MSDPQSSLSWQSLFARRPVEHPKLGLERMRRALEILRFDLPPAVLVAGTNGKGTTTGSLWHLLAAARARVGLFTSPHLLHFRERIRCSHRRVTDAQLHAQLAEIQARLPVDLAEALSFFELNTLL